MKHKARSSRRKAPQQKIGRRRQLNRVILKRLPLFPPVPHSSTDNGGEGNSSAQLITRLTAILAGSLHTPAALVYCPLVVATENDVELFEITDQVTRELFHFSRELLAKSQMKDHPHRPDQVTEWNTETRLLAAQSELVWELFMEKLRADFPDLDQLVQVEICFGWKVTARKELIPEGFELTQPIREPYSPIARESLLH